MKSSALCLLFILSATPCCAQSFAAPPPASELKEPAGAAVHNDELLQNYAMCGKEEHNQVTQGKCFLGGKDVPCGPHLRSFAPDVSDACQKLGKEVQARRGPAASAPAPAKEKAPDRSEIDAINAAASKLK